MATVATTEPVKMEDVAGVRSRISWPAIVAGAVVAVAINFVLTLFFASLGLTIAEAGVRAGAVGTGALIAALVGIVVSLFAGGWTSTQLTAGESERESVLYGILTWALVVGFSLAIVGMGARAGYFAIVGGSMIGQQNPAVQQKIDSMKATVEQKADQTNDQLKDDPAARERAEKAAVGAAWAALVGIMLSMAASVVGAMVGRGPSFRMIPTSRAVVVRREVAIP